MAVSCNTDSVLGRCSRHSLIDRLLRLLRIGATVAVHRSSRAQTNTGIPGHGGAASAQCRSSIHYGDIGTLDGILALLEEVIDLHGNIDYAVNTAGALLRRPDAPDSECHKMLAYMLFVDGQQSRANEQYREVLGGII